MQGGTRAAPPTWATLRPWLRSQSKHGVLLVFENSEEMLQDDTCEVLFMFNLYLPLYLIQLATLREQECCQLVVVLLTWRKSSVRLGATTLQWQLQSLCLFRGSLMVAVHAEWFSFGAQEFETLLEDLQRWHVMVLVTSRQAVGVSLGQTEPLELGPLPADTSMRLLTKSAGSGIVRGEDEAAELVGICGYNALAITLLAGLLKSTYCTPQVPACADRRTHLAHRVS